MLLHDIQNNQTTQIAKIWNSKFAGALVKMSFFTLPDYGCIYSMIEISFKSFDKYDHSNKIYLVPCSNMYLFQCKHRTSYLS